MMSDKTLYLYCLTEAIAKDQMWAEDSPISPIVPHCQLAVVSAPKLATFVVAAVFACVVLVLR